MVQSTLPTARSLYDLFYYLQCDAKLKQVTNKPKSINLTQFDSDLASGLIGLKALYALRCM